MARDVLVLRHIGQGPLQLLLRHIEGVVIDGFLGPLESLEDQVDLAKIPVNWGSILFQIPPNGAMKGRRRARRVFCFGGRQKQRRAWPGKGNDEPAAQLDEHGAGRDLGG